MSLHIRPKSKDEYVVFILFCIALPVPGAFVAYPVYLYAKSKLGTRSHEE